MCQIYYTLVLKVHKYLFKNLQFRLFFYIFDLAPTTSYTKLSLKHCWTQKYNVYSTVAAAQAACTADSNCKAVYDQGCDQSTNDVYLCPTLYSGSLYSYSTSSSSCIYEKH